MTQYDPHLTEKKSKTNEKTTYLIFGGCLVTFICALCFVGLGMVGYGSFQNFRQDSSQVTENVNATRAIIATRRSQSTSTPVPLLPTQTIVEREGVEAERLPPTAVSVEATGTRLNFDVPDKIDQNPEPMAVMANLDALLAAEYPINDYFETAVRLGKRDLGSRTVGGAKYQIGDVARFIYGNKNIEAVLMEISEHAYFWVDTDLNLDPTAVAKAADKFEQSYYKPTTNLFGSFWQPGIDNDPRFSILHASVGADDGELGRFSRYDEFPKSVFESSNEQEIVYLNLEDMTIGSDLYFGTLVHELQHLIQWHVDSNEALWVTEGLSQLAELNVDLYTSSPSDYAQFPEIQLNTWLYDEPELYAHYSAAYLFMTYIWEQLGSKAIAELAASPANGMAGVNSVLIDYGVSSLSDFVGDWAAANYIDDINAGSAYYYSSFDFKRPKFAEVVRGVPFDIMSEIEQFGVHYINLNALKGPTTIRFAGDTVQPIINSTPASGEKMWFAPPMKEVNAQLTAAFDLSSLSQATLHYKIWYDLEPNFDYAYVSISTNNGADWDILSADNSTVGEFGPAYNGRSTSGVVEDGWIEESISLDAYVGQIVLIRFEVITDFDITNKGVAIDDISIPELNNYRQDVEGSLEGWQANGFVPMGQLLPQQWSIKLIEEGPEPEITTLPLDRLNQGEWTVDIGKGGAVLVIVPTTPFLKQPADYWLQVNTP